MNTETRELLMDIAYFLGNQLDANPDDDEARALYERVNEAISEELQP